MTKNDPILVLASGNAGKIREFQAMFSHLNVHVESQKTFGVKPCPEPFTPLLKTVWPRLGMPLKKPDVGDG